METKFCPYLGIEEEKISHFDYPSTRNRCWQSGNPKDVDTNHQGNYCLSLDYQACPIFVKPPPVQEEIHPKSGRNWKVISLWAGLTAILLVVILLIGAIIIRPSFLPDSVNARSLVIWNYVVGALSSSSNLQSPTENQTPNDVRGNLYPVPTANLQNLSPTQTPVLPASTMKPGSLNPYPVAEVEGAEVAFVVDQVNDEGEISGTDLINQVPNSYGVRISSEENIQLESSFAVPGQEHSEIYIEDQVIKITRNETITYQHEGPGFLVRIENISNQSDNDNVIKVSPDGTRILYQSGDANEISISQSFETGAGQWYFSIRNIDTLPASEVVLVVDLQNETLDLVNEMFRGGIYDIEIAQIQDDVLVIFLNSNIEIGPSETHHYDLLSMGNSNFLTLSRDNFSDGTIDRTSLLENSSKFQYLPMLMNN